MNILKAHPVYDVRDQDNLRAVVAQSDQQNIKKNTNIEMGRAKLILQASDGSRWQVVVDPAGVLSTVAA